jgi:hypothetical protein
MRIVGSLAVFLLALTLGIGLTACSNDGDQSGDETAVSAEITEEETGTTEEEATEDPGDKAGGSGEPEGPARSKKIDELLGVHPIFPTKRFMNFAARGNPGACSLLSAKGRKAVEKAQGKPCEVVIRSAAKKHDQPGLMIKGEFVPQEEFSNLDYRATIYVFEGETGRITINRMRPPVKLARYGRVWLIDSLLIFDEIGARQ